MTTHQNHPQWHQLINSKIADFTYCLHIRSGRLIELDRVSDSFREITGYSAQELNQRGGWITLFHPEDTDRVVERFSKTQVMQPEPAEFRIITKGGETCWIRDYSISSSVSNQQIEQICGAVKYITAQKRQRSAQSENTAHFNSIIEDQKEELRLVQQNMQKEIADRKRIEKKLKYHLDENKRLFEQVSQRTQDLESLAEVTNTLQIAETRENMLPILANETADILNADAIALLIVENDELTMVDIPGRRKMPAGYRQPVTSNDVFWQVLHTGEPVYISGESGNIEYTPNPLYSALMKDMTSGAIIPIRTAQTKTGLLLIGYHRNKNKFLDEDRRLFTLIAEIAANALYRANALENLEQRVQSRTRRLTALHDITAITSQSIDLQTILERSLEKVVDTLSCKASAIYHLDQNAGLLRLFLQRGLPDEIPQYIRTLEIDSDPKDKNLQDADRLFVVKLEFPHRNRPEVFRRINTYIGAPIKIKEQIFGLVGVFADSIQQYTREDIASLRAIADQIGIAMHNDRLRQQAEIAAIMEERQRVARELHDSVNQLLFSLNAFAQAGQNFARAKQWEKAEDSLDNLLEASTLALKEMRRLIFELRPMVLENEGLEGAIRSRLEAVEQRIGIHTNLLVEGHFEIPTEIEETLFHITQEALNNALKHAGATKVQVRITADNNLLELEIMDNGCGFVPENEKKPGRIGLMNMQDRADQAQADLVIQSQPGEGTIIKITLKGDGT